MTKKTQTKWSFAKDRRMIQLAATLKSLEAVADEMKLTPKNVARTVKRLGISLKSDHRKKAKK
jgi:transposase